MLPALATTAAVMPVARGLVQSSFVRSLLTGGFFLAVATGAYFLFRSVIQKIKREQALNQVGAGSPQGLAIGYASRCYAAMNSGHAWWNDWIGDGTNEEALYAVARDMRTNQVSFALVSHQYKTLYDRDLYADLTAELAADEMAQFQAALSTGLGDLYTPTPLISHRLGTRAPAVILNAELQPVYHVPERVNLGEHDESLVLADGTILHGFLYLGQRRYVAATSVHLLPLPS